MSLKRYRIISNISGMRSVMEDFDEPAEAMEFMMNKMIAKKNETLQLVDSKDYSVIKSIRGEA